MFREGLTLVSLGAALCGGLFSPSLRAEPLDKQTHSAPIGLVVQVEDRYPFTHFAYIPAGSDLSSIRFEKAIMLVVTIKTDI